MQFFLNDKAVEIEVEKDAPLLWVLREVFRLTGTKFGCGIGQCGACTVHIDGVAMRSCLLPMSFVKEKSVTTIEGLERDGKLHPLQESWVKENVPQCGYCQSGQIMTACALLKSIPSPTDEQINTAMEGNLCRCGTYPRIKKAIKRTIKTTQNNQLSIDIRHELND